MTVTETEPAAAAELSELPDSDAPEIGTARRAHEVKVGWHVRVDGRWLLVVRAGITPKDPIGPPFYFGGGAMLTVHRQTILWTRDPGEQIAYIASVLPACDHYQPPRPMATLYGGSAPSPLVD